METNGFEDLCAAGVYAANDIVAVGAKGARQRQRRLGKLIRDPLSVSSDRLDGARAAAADSSDHIVGVGANGAAREFGSVCKTRRHPVAVRLDRLDDGILRGLDASDQILAPLPQAGQQVVADRFETIVDFPDARQDVPGGLLARVGEAFGQGFADRRDRYAHPCAFGDDALERRGAGAVHRDGYVVRRRPERNGQFLADFGEALAQIAAGHVEVRRDAVMGRRYGVADPCPAGYDRLALIGHLGDEQANLAFIIRIRALERRNLRSHAGLELRGARERALDAIPHRREFATDGLGQVRHMVARHCLGFGQTHGDLGDRARRLSQLAQPSRQRGEGEHEDDWPERRQQK